MTTAEARKKLFRVLLEFATNKTGMSAIVSAIDAFAEAVRAECEVRPVVMIFAKLMEQKLRENEHKGGWKHDDLESLLTRVKQETEELEFCIVEASKSSEICDEAADVANFAMMIADNTGALK